MYIYIIYIYIYIYIHIHIYINTCIHTYINAKDLMSFSHLSWQILSFDVSTY